MNVDQIQDILGVSWFDGLLVNSQHLDHVETRVDGIMSRGIDVMMDQPGLLGQESGSPTAHQLIEFDSQSESDAGVRVRLNITRAFQAVTPEGRLVVGIPNNQSRFGVPTSIVEGVVPSDAAGADLLVCVRQTEAPELKIQANQADGRAIELSYPALHVELVPETAYSQGVTSTYRSVVPIGLIHPADGQFTVDGEYIPPVVRLELVNTFDQGILTAINTLLHDLHRIATDMLQSAVITSAQGDVGVDLISRRTEYAALSGLMLTKLGLVKHIGRLSPFRLLQEVVYPIATWWKQYYNRQFKQATGMEHSPVQRLLTMSNQLCEITHGDVCASSHVVLNKTKQFIEALNNEFVVG